MKKASAPSILVAMMLLAVGVTAQAQQPVKIPRIGWLGADPQAPTRETFLQGLRDLGYVEGQSILVEWRFAETSPIDFLTLPPSWFASKLTQL
jgi:hypothetical protein